MFTSDDASGKNAAKVTSAPPPPPPPPPPSLAPPPPSPGQGIPGTSNTGLSVKDRIKALNNFAVQLRAKLEQDPYPQATDPTEFIKHLTGDEITSLIDKCFKQSPEDRALVEKLIKGEAIQFDEPQLEAVEMQILRAVMQSEFAKRNRDRQLINEELEKLFNSKHSELQTEEQISEILAKMMPLQERKSAVAQQKEQLDKQKRTEEELAEKQKRTANTTDIKAQISDLSREESNLRNEIKRMEMQLSKLQGKQFVREEQFDIYENCLIDICRLSNAPITEIEGELKKLERELAQKLPGTKKSTAASAANSANITTDPDLLCNTDDVTTRACRHMLRLHHKLTLEQIRQKAEGNRKKEISMLRKYENELEQKQQEKGKLMPVEQMVLEETLAEVSYLLVEHNEKSHEFQKTNMGAFISALKDRSQTSEDDKDRRVILQNISRYTMQRASSSFNDLAQQTEAARAIIRSYGGTASSERGNVQNSAAALVKAKEAEENEKVALEQVRKQLQDTKRELSELQTTHHLDTELKKYLEAQHRLYPLPGAETPDSSEDQLRELEKNDKAAKQTLSQLKNDTSGKDNSKSIEYWEKKIAQLAMQIEQLQKSIETDRATIAEFEKDRIRKRIGVLGLREFHIEKKLSYHQRMLASLSASTKKAQDVHQMHLNKQNAAEYESYRLSWRYETYLERKKAASAALKSKPDTQVSKAQESDAERIAREALEAYEAEFAPDNGNKQYIVTSQGSPYSYEELSILIEMVVPARVQAINFEREDLLQELSTRLNATFGLPTERRIPSSSLGFTPRTIMTEWFGYDFYTIHPLRKQEKEFLGDPQTDYTQLRGEKSPYREPEINKMLETLTFIDGHKASNETELEALLKERILRDPDTIKDPKDFLRSQLREALGTDVILRREDDLKAKNRAATMGAATREPEPTSPDSTASASTLDSLIPIPSTGAQNQDSSVLLAQRLSEIQQKANELRFERERREKAETELQRKEKERVAEREARIKAEQEAEKAKKAAEEAELKAKQASQNAGGGASGTQNDGQDDISQYRF